MYTNIPRHCTGPAFISRASVLQICEIVYLFITSFIYKTNCWVHVFATWQQLILNIHTVHSPRHTIYLVEVIIKQSKEQIKMSTIKIRKYKPEDHKDVNRIFGENIVDFQHIKDGIVLGWQSPYVITYLAILFFIGFLYSITYGIIALLSGMAFHAICLFSHYHIYAW